MQNKYKYDSITVNTKTGNRYYSDYCDYYVQDNVLTVFRKESFSKSGGEYYKMEEHFPIEIVERIMCVENRKVV